jgi:circadian clock protein KaiC
VTRHGIEEYVTDCVIVLDHRVHQEISTRRLRVIKYRGSAHGTNEYPFLISARGIAVLPVTSMSLDYRASDERISTGVERLDHMLGGGLFRGSTILLSGTAGTGKTSVGAHLIAASCERGERTLLVNFEESPDQFVRNMRSIGLDFQPWIDSGLLRIWATRPTAFGPETHLAMLAQLLEDDPPSVAVLDGLAGLAADAPAAELLSMVSRQADMLKSRGITTLMTEVSPAAGSATVGISSMVDTWLLLRNIEANGERNRLLFVLKSRGTAHSNQVREFVLTDHGVELIDVYIGAEGVVTGSARLAQEAAQRDAETREDAELLRHRHELHRSVIEREAHLAALQDQLDADRSEIARIDLRDRHQIEDTEADRSAMAARRWADAEPVGGGRP